MDFQALHTEAISSIWTKTTHVTLWVIVIILLGMICALCVGYKLYKDKPEPKKLDEVNNKYVERIDTNPQSSYQDQQPSQKTLTIVKGNLVAVDN